MEDDIKVTVIATGLGGQERVLSRPRTNTVVEETVTEMASVEMSTPEVTEEVREEVQVMAEAPLEKMNMNEKEEDSSLVKSIKEAATRYEASKVETTPAAPVKESRDMSNNGRARSIAEKLGFINFDEEELDTPSYLRRDEELRKKPEPTPRV
jgi:cell division protein FtsZ